MYSPFYSGPGAKDFPITSGQINPQNSPQKSRKPSSSSSHTTASGSISSSTMVGLPSYGSHLGASHYANHVDPNYVASLSHSFSLGGHSHMNHNANHLNNSNHTNLHHSLSLPPTPSITSSSSSISNGTSSDYTKKTLSTSNFFRSKLQKAASTIGSGHLAAANSSSNSFGGGGGVNSSVKWKRSGASVTSTMIAPTKAILDQIEYQSVLAEYASKLNEITIAYGQCREELHSMRVSFESNKDAVKSHEAKLNELKIVHQKEIQALQQCHEESMEEMTMTVADLLEQKRLLELQLVKNGMEPVTVDAKNLIRVESDDNSKDDEILKQDDPVFTKFKSLVSNIFKKLDHETFNLQPPLEDSKNEKDDGRDQIEKDGKVDQIEKDKGKDQIEKDDGTDQIEKDGKIDQIETTEKLTEKSNQLEKLQFLPKNNPKDSGTFEEIVVTDLEEGKDGETVTLTSNDKFSQSQPVLPLSCTIIESDPPSIRLIEADISGSSCAETSVHPDKEINSQISYSHPESECKAEPTIPVQNVVNLEKKTTTRLKSNMILHTLEATNRRMQERRKKALAVGMTNDINVGEKTASASASAPAPDPSESPTNEYGNSELAQSILDNLSNW